MALTVADRIEIMELQARYAEAIDFGEPEAWADCFTVDGAFESTIQGRFEGRETLIAFHKRTPPGFKPRHWTTNWIIEGDGETATARCYGLLLDGAKGGQPILSFRYRDRLRKVDGCWKFEERFADIDERPAAGSH